MRLCLATIVSFLLLPFLGTSQTSKPSAWSGVIVYSSCNADEAFNESPECYRSTPGATLALYDDTSRVMYSLDPQEKVAGHLGEVVTIHGTLDEDSIHVTQLAPLAVGLPVGQRAPAFSLPDQFGNMQTLDSLKGKNGTVLLFFRSADW